MSLSREEQELRDRFFKTLLESTYPMQRGPDPEVTLEALIDDGNEPYKLNPSGRYAHRQNYIRDVLESADLQVLTIEQGCLRRERGHEVVCYCVVAQKARSS